jgi:hypothetical protein
VTFSWTLLSHTISHCSLLEMRGLWKYTECILKNVVLLITYSYVNMIILILFCIIETESVKPLIQSDVSDSRSKLYQVEITGPVIEPAESGSVVYQIKKCMEDSTRGTQEELIGDMLVAVLK